MGNFASCRNSKGTRGGGVLPRVVRGGQGCNVYIGGYI